MLEENLPKTENVNHQEDKNEENQQSEANETTKEIEVNEHNPEGERESGLDLAL